MKTTKLITIACFSSLLFVMTSCKKNQFDNKTNSVAKASIPAFPFDWETADYMPTPSGTNPILVPWASGSNQLFEPEIASDFKSADGWNLVYNTFNTTAVTSPQFFVLYNKYSGLLRFYMYLQPGTATPSTYFSDGLSLSGSPASSFLNYGKDVTDVANPLTSISKIHNFRIQSTGAWFVSQFETTYDPNLTNINSQSLSMIWNTASINVSSVNLNGEINGTLTGTIGAGSPGGFNLGSVVNAGANGAVFAAGLSGLSALKLGSGIIVKSITDGLKSGLTGAAKNFLSGIIGGTSSSPQLANLTLKTNVKLTGDITSVSGIANPTLAIPGTAGSQTAAGYVPKYNSLLGVLNMTENPKVHLSVDSSVQTFHYAGGSNTVRTYNHHYRLDGISATVAPKNVIFNPAVTSDGTTVQLLREDIVVPVDTVNSGPNGTNGNPTFPITSGRYAGFEKIGVIHYAAVDASANQAIDINTSISGVTNFNNVRFDNVKYKETFVRLTVLVTPANGAKPITIIKSFKANLIP